jgi:putative acetyltransferase
MGGGGNGGAAPVLRLHPFVPAYLPEMTDLWVESWAETGLPIDFAARRGWFVERITGLAGGGANVLCAFDAANGAMAGFVTIDPGSGWLDQIAVSATHKGSGVAGALLAAARAASPGGIRLDVNAANGRARAFYAREGFVETGRGVSPASGLATVVLEWRPVSRQT